MAITVKCDFCDKQSDNPNFCSCMDDNNLGEDMFFCKNSNSPSGSIICEHCVRVCVQILNERNKRRRDIND